MTTDFSITLTGAAKMEANLEYQGRKKCGFYIFVPSVADLLSTPLTTNVTVYDCDLAGGLRQILDDIAREFSLASFFLTPRGWEQLWSSLGANIERMFLPGSPLLMKAVPWIDRGITLGVRKLLGDILPPNVVRDINAQVISFVNELLKEGTRSAKWFLAPVAPVSSRYVWWWIDTMQGRWSTVWSSWNRQC